MLMELKKKRKKAQSQRPRTPSHQAPKEPTVLHEQITTTRLGAVPGAFFNGENSSPHTTSRSTLYVSSTISFFAPPVKLSCFLAFFPSSLQWATGMHYQLYFSHMVNLQLLGSHLFPKTKTTDIIEGFLKIMGWKYLCLDGGTKTEERTGHVQLFNAKDSEITVFVLSTRAGGLSLNLQMADTVIIFDSDWNPHADLQAQDHAHHIGQTKSVRILHFITEKCVGEATNPCTVQTRYQRQGHSYWSL